MGQKLFLNCNRAIVEAAIQSGCRFFAGYPFTPATECLEQASHRTPTRSKPTCSGSPRSTGGSS